MLTRHTFVVFVPLIPSLTELFSTFLEYKHKIATTRKYSFEYRRRHPKIFPEVCDVCRPKRRFQAPANKVQHVKGIQQQRIYDHPPSSSSLSTITASDLNKFVKEKIEDDIEYNKSYKEVVGPTKVKTLIRLIKYWRKTWFEESTGKKRLPSSYPLELITIWEWEDAGRPVKFDLRKGFFHVLLAIANYKKLKHVWSNNYDSKQYTSFGDDSCYVMDPAKPFNNVMEACKCWDLVESKTRQFLHMPLFNGLSTSSGWT